MNQKIIAFNKAQRELKNVGGDVKIPELRAGDVIKVHRRIKEGAKTRTQMFQGMVIAVNGGQSSSPTVTVRKVSSGVGVELILPLYSPQIEKIEFVKRTRARRSKIYFVRDKSVKVLSKKLKEIPLPASILAFLNKKEETPVVEEVVEDATPLEEVSVEEAVETPAAPAEVAPESEEKSA
jgi:large subunit ribosomal protein L19